MIHLKLRKPLRKTFIAGLGTCLVASICMMTVPNLAFAESETGTIGDNCIWSLEDEQITIAPKNSKKVAILEPDEIGGDYPDKSEVSSIKIEKGVKVTKAKAISGLFEYWCDITTAEFSALDVSSLTDLSNLFSNEYDTQLTSLKSVNLSGWDVSNVTSASGMFVENYSLKQADLSGWNTANLKNTSDMFSLCTKLKELNISGWNTSSLQNASNMFSSCESLSQLDVSNWDTSSLTNVSQMFRDTRFSSLDLSAWSLSNVENLKGMFMECSKLKELNISGWDITPAQAKKLKTAEMFENCIKLKTLVTDNKVFKKLLVAGKDYYTLWKNAKSYNFKTFRYKANKYNKIKIPAKKSLTGTGHNVVYKFYEKATLTRNGKSVSKSKIKLSKNGKYLIVKNLPATNLYYHIFVTAKCGTQTRLMDFTIKSK